MAQIIVTGIPHSGTSMLTEYLSKIYEAPLPRDQLHRHGYNTYESTLLQNGYDKELFKQIFPSDYLWKTVYLPEQLFEIKKDLSPDMVYITLRDPVYHGHSVSKRYDRFRMKVAEDFKASYPLLVRVALHFPTTVVLAEELAEKLDTDRLSKDETPCPALEELRNDPNFITLKQLGEANVSKL